MKNSTSILLYFGIIYIGNLITLFDNNILSILILASSYHIIKQLEENGKTNK